VWKLGKMQKQGGPWPPRVPKMSSPAGLEKKGADWLEVEKKLGKRVWRTKKRGGDFPQVFF